MRSLIFLLGVAHLALSQPSTKTIGSDLTFLFQNDLNWPNAHLHNGTILVSSPSTKAQALAACSQLNEALLPPTGQFFKDDINQLLTYLAFKSRDKMSSKQQFWIGGGNTNADANAGFKSHKPAPKTCSAISLSGGIQSVSCSLNLPAFCAQSAPYRRNTDVDPNPNFRVTVESQGANFVGTRDALSFRFIGIPYATPTERFTYSKPNTFAGSGGTVNALNFGSPCIQLGGTGAEDCLFLNIFTPFLPSSSSTTKGKDAKSTHDLRPVMFWIHGGGFTGGEGSDSIYDGGNMVSRSDVVVVTINYRLGSLGFLALTDGVTNGNYAIGDQITALQFIHTHIPQFGGDPSRITIFGQSAGAGSVRALLASPPSFGLYAAAIAQSNLGGFGYAHTYTEWMSIEDQFTNFAEPTIVAVGCGNVTQSEVLGCLRKVDAVVLQSAVQAPRYVVVDGRIVRTRHLMLNGEGPTADVHVVFGWMRDDGADFVGSFPGAGESVDGAVVGAGLNPTIAQKVVSSSLFPMPKGTNATMNVFNVTARIGTDGEFLCIDQATLIAASTNRVFPSVWGYQFDRSYKGFEPIPNTCEPPPSPGFPNGDPSLPYFRCHSGDLYFTFGNMGQDSQPFRDPNDLLISQVSVDAWGSFVRSFNPNPDVGFLKARGYLSTMDVFNGEGGMGVLQGEGVWPGVRGGFNPDAKGSNNAPQIRIMDVPFSNSPWREVEQCDALGLPLSMFLES